jgi:hypothetical protein
VVHVGPLVSVPCAMGVRSEVLAIQLGFSVMVRPAVDGARQ